jgi:pyrroloquinoline quinone biosynthesis protein B
VAVRGFETTWAVVNASPDIPQQVRSLCGDVAREGGRHSALECVFLTNGDLDHVLGLLQLREGGTLKVAAPDSVWESLVNGLRIPQVLDSYCGVERITVSTEWTFFPGLGLHARMVPLRGTSLPRYDAASRHGVHSVGYLFREMEKGPMVGIFPDVAVLDDALVAELAPCELVFFDGTFWENDELGRQKLGVRTAADMGHVPIFGPGGSLDRLASLALPTCAYLHINNTNPILRPDSEERRTVEEKGLVVANDGMKFIL